MIFFMYAMTSFHTVIHNCNSGAERVKFANRYLIHRNINYQDGNFCVS